MQILQHSSASVIDFLALDIILHASLAEQFLRDSRPI
jgi:hypothetical protein